MENYFFTGNEVFFSLWASPFLGMENVFVYAEISPMTVYCIDMKLHRPHTF